MKEKLQLQKCAEKLAAAKKVAVLTGAGISTESGIPDFRSPGGLWEKAEVRNAITRDCFYGKPDVFYHHFNQLFLPWDDVHPNQGHQALADLEHKHGKWVGIATQNIDGLHQKAGSTQVAELHGHLHTATCPRCQNMIPMEAVKANLKEGELPKCDCGQFYKPDVVLFGDMLPQDIWHKAMVWMGQADFIFCVGTSLTVTPANTLILRRHSECTLCIINKEPTQFDHAADFVFHGSAGEMLTSFLDSV